MKKTIFLFLFLTLFVLSFSQNQWNQIHPYPTLKNLHDVHFNSEEEGWITGNGNDGAIMYTNDAGVTWETQLSGQGAPYTSLFFIDENEGWAGGWKCIWHTTDKGNTWESQSVPDVDYIIEDIFFINHNVGWAVGINNTIMKTTDGGLNWTLIMNSNSSVIRFSSVNFTDEMHGCAVGGFMYYDDGFIMITTDGGITWSDVSPPDCYGFTKVIFIDSLTGWVCGFGGTGGQPAELHNTTDGGLTWTKHVIGNHTWFRDIHFVNQDTGMILDDSKVHLTYNGGITWDSTYYIGAYTMRRLSFWDDHGCYSVGYTGRIIKSTDLGQSWENVGQSFGSRIYNIGFFDSYNGLALAGTFLLYRTENGGYSWELDTLISNGDFYLLRIYGSSGYLLNTNSQIMKTSNGGENWVLLDIPHNTSYYKDLQFVNENTGYLCGNFGVLKKTIDGGITWEDKSLSSNHNFTSLHFLNDDLGWMIDMNNKTLLKTTDGGDSWNDVGLSNVRSMYFIDENIGFATTFGGVVYKTTNSGVTWEEICILQHPGSVYFINEYVGWYFMSNTVYYTYDGGLTWQDDQYFEYTSIRSIYFLDDEQGWIAGDNGFVATCDFTLDISDLVNNSTTISVFPNPVHEDIQIKLHDKQGKIKDVKVFNLQGQQIIHFSNFPEINSFKFNVSSFKSGIYVMHVKLEYSDNLVKFIVQ